MSRADAAGWARSSVPVGVGGADDPVPAPRDDEQHRGRRTQDQPGLAGDRRAGHHQVHALGRRTRSPGRAAAGASSSRDDVVAPHAGRGDDGAGRHVELLAGLQVADPDAGHLAGVPEQPDGRALVTTAAPRLAAVRASVTTSRASSTWPS